MIKKTIKQNRKLLLKFVVSFVITAVILAGGCITASALSAAEPGSSAETQILTENPQDEIADTSLMQSVFGIDGSQSLEIILLITVLSVAPSFLVMVTSFTRLVIVFSFLRNAMQTQSIPPNSVLTGLALFLTLFIMWPTFTQINEDAYQPYSAGEITITEMAERAAKPLKTFMQPQTDSAQENSAAAQDEPFIEDILGRDAVNLAETEAPLTDYTDQLGLETVIPAFIVSELTRAFQMGFLLFIPFLVIDIVVSSTLMAMGMMMLPPSMISMPFKIMLFVLVDGWQLLVGTVVSSFNV